MSADKQDIIKDGKEANLELKPAAKNDLIDDRIDYDEDEEAKENQCPPPKDPGEMRGEKQSTVGANKPTNITQSKRSRDKEEEEKVEIKGDAPDDAVPESAGMASSTSFEGGPEAKPRTRGAAWIQPQYPGAVAIDGFDASDVEDGTVVVGGGESENENPAPNDEIHLAQANLVEDPLLVSAAEIKCICGPYGGFTAVPAVFASIGSICSIFALIRCFADYKNIDNCLILDPVYYYYSIESHGFGFAMGLLSSSLGAIAFIASTVLGCRVVSARFLKILGGVYIVSGVLSLLMLVELGSESCKLLGCTLSTGAWLAIGAFFAYVGAGISTFYMIKKKQFNIAS